MKDNIILNGNHSYAIQPCENNKKLFIKFTVLFVEGIKNSPKTFKTYDGQWISPVRLMPGIGFVKNVD